MKTTPTTKGIILFFAAIFLQNTEGWVMKSVQWPHLYELDTPNSNFATASGYKWSYPDWIDMTFWAYGFAHLYLDTIADNDYYEKSIRP